MYAVAVLACLGGAGLVRYAFAASISPPAATLSIPGGDPGQGAVLIRAYGCGSCHIVPGVPGADGLVGPPLIKFAARRYIAGRLPNTADNLITWIQHPQQIEPGTVMPDLGVGEQNARNMAAYLETLR